MRHLARVIIRPTLIAGALMLAVGGSSMIRAEDPNVAPMPPEMPPEQKAMMEAFEKHATPGPEHEKLNKMVGDWTAKTTGYMPDGSVCAEGAGTMTVKSILGGRFVEIHFIGEMSGPMGKMPFEGRGIAGYDNTKKKCTSVWIDSMSTSVMMTEGTQEGNVTTLTGTTTDPMTGKPSVVKEVVTQVDDSHHNYELHMTGPDGAMFKCVEVKYTKKS